MGTNRSTNLRKSRGSAIAATSFFGLILWAIYLANTGSDSRLLSIPKLLPYGDKIGHIVLFGLLTFLVNLALGMRTPGLQGMSKHWGTVAVLGFVLAEELSQGFIASRTMDYRDFIADLLGIGIGATVSHALLAVRKP